MSEDNCAFFASSAKWDGRGREWECVKCEVGGDDLNEDLVDADDDGDASLLFGELLALLESADVEDRFVLPRNTPSGDPMTLPIPLGDVDDDDDVCPLPLLRPASLAPDPLPLPLLPPPLLPAATSPMPFSPAHK
jgi:hypothetical protein